MHALACNRPKSPLSVEAVVDLLAVLNTYRSNFPSEAEALNLVQGFLASAKSEDLYSRKNFNGHLTASAFILSADGKSVLLLHHKSLDRWLQPGGHIDATDGSIIAATFREVVEETGITKENLKLLPIGIASSIPFDIDSHPIPANPKKGEAAHVHHDFRYLLQVKDSVTVEVSTEESNGFRWVSLEELCKIEDHAKVAEKIARARPPR